MDAIVQTTRRYCQGRQVGAEYDIDRGDFQAYPVFGNTIDEVLMMTDLDSSNSITNGDDYGHDHLYSPVVFYGPSGVVLERYEYDAYGKVQVLAPNSELRTNSSYANAYSFTGRELDTLDNNTLHLMYYRARTYDPETGRFMQRDPSGYIDGMSLYEYVKSSPFSFIDPFGLASGDVEDPDIEFFGLGVWVGVGAGISCDLQIDWKDCCCNGRHLQGLYDAVVTANASAGFGLGGKVKILGLGYDLSWKGPSIDISQSVKISNSKCGDYTPTSGSQCRTVNAQLAPGSISIAYNIFTLDVNLAKVDFSLKQCIEVDASSIDVALYGQAGEVTMSALIRLGPIKIKEWVLPGSDEMNKGFREIKRVNIFSFPKSTCGIK